MNTSFVIIDCKARTATVIESKAFIAQYILRDDTEPSDIEYIRTYREDEAFDPCI